MIVSLPGGQFDVPPKLLKFVKDGPLLFIGAHAILVSVKCPDGKVLDLGGLDEVLRSFQTTPCGWCCSGKVGRAS